MKLSLFADRVASAIYISGMSRGTFEQRAAAMKQTVITLVSDGFIKEQLAAMIYVRALRMMQRIEGAPLSPRTPNRRLRRNVN
jgi:hypothetical protein